MMTMKDLTASEYDVLHTLLDETCLLEDELALRQLSLSQVQAQLSTFLEQVQTVAHQIQFPLHSRFHACFCLEQSLGTLSTNDALFLYTLLLNDQGLLWEPQEDRDEEQNLLSYLTLQEQRPQLEATLREYAVLHAEFAPLAQHCRHLDAAIPSAANEEEVQAIFQLLLTHFPSYESLDKEILLNNLRLLSGLAQTKPPLSAVAPLFFYLVITRHFSKLSSAPAFHCRFEKIWTYKEYQTDVDNGKNFNHLAALLAFFENLCAYYQSSSAINLPLCAYGFSNTSNIGEWYFQYAPSKQESSLPKPLRTLLAECQVDCCNPGGVFDCSLEELDAFYQEEKHRQRLWLALDSYCSQHSQPLEAYIENSSQNPPANRKVIYELVDAIQKELTWLTPAQLPAVCSEIDLFLSLKMNEQALLCLERIGQQLIKKEACCR